MIVVLITDVSSPKGFVITTVFLRGESAGILILSKFLGETNEYVEISLQPIESIVLSSFLVYFCSGVSLA